jgi:hypothetical protein
MSQDEARKESCGARLQVEHFRATCQTKLTSQKRCGCAVDICVICSAVALCCGAETPLAGGNATGRMQRSGAAVRGQFSANITLMIIIEMPV